MATILATRFPCKATELMAYQATIVRAERNYEGNAGSLTTGNPGGRPWHGRTSTCLLWMPSCTTRHSPGKPEQLPNARVAWKMTTQRPAAPGTLTAQCLAGCHPPELPSSTTATPPPTPAAEGNLQVVQRGKVQECAKVQVLARVPNLLGGRPLRPRVPPQAGRRGA